MKKLFFVGLIPPEPYRSEIDALKQEWKELYGVSHALKSPPHITIIPPFTGEADTLHDFLLTSARGLHPFQVSLSGYGSFPRRVIYLRPQAPELAAVYRHYQKHWSSYPSCPSYRGSLPDKEDGGDRGGDRFIPHITLAHRDLTPDTYDRIWEEVSGREYSRVFTIDRISLLRHNGRHWEIDLQVRWEHPSVDSVSTTDR